MPERRNTVRNLCSDIAELTWNDRFHRQQRTKGVLEDISDSGACVQTEEEIPLDSEITFRLRESRFEATVCYCTLIGGGYFVGIKFAIGKGWTPGSIDPEYLLQIPQGMYGALALHSDA